MSIYISNCEDICLMVSHQNVICLMGSIKFKFTRRYPSDVTSLVNSNRCSSLFRFKICSFDLVFEVILKGSMCYLSLGMASEDAWRERKLDGKDQGREGRRFLNPELGLRFCLAALANNQNDMTFYLYFFEWVTWMLTWTS